MNRYLVIGKTFNNYRIILKKYFVLPVYFRMGGGIVSNVHDNKAFH